HPGLVALGGEENVVVDVVFKDAHHGDLHHHAVWALDADGVADACAAELGQLFADHRAVARGPVHGLTLVGETEEGGDFGIVGGHHIGAAHALVGEGVHGLA